VPRPACGRSAQLPDETQDRGRTPAITLDVARMSADELKRRFDRGDPFAVLDVREDEERAFCAIPVPSTVINLHIPVAHVPARFADLRIAPKPPRWSSTATTACARWPSPPGSRAGASEASTTSMAESPPGPIRSIRPCRTTESHDRWEMVNGKFEIKNFKYYYLN
jgi:hypothetical protein